MKGKRVKVILNPDRAEDRRILDYLYYAGIPHSKAIKTAVLSYLDRESGQKEDPLLQQVRETIRESVRSLRIVTDEQGPAGLNSTEFEESPVSPLDFLEELEKGPSFEEKGPPLFP